MMGMRVAAIATVSLALLIPVASAQPVSSERGDIRFTFHRADDGYLRLDGRSGQVSLCNRRASGWQCQLVPDERLAFEAEIARLQSENVALKKELVDLGQPAEGVRSDLRNPGSASPKSSGQRLQVPDEAELDRAMNFLERIWRRVVEMIVSVQRDIQRRF
jgi:hypothetical protein